MHYSLPELNDRRGGVGVGDVGSIFSIGVNTILCGHKTFYWNHDIHNASMSVDKGAFIFIKLMG